MHLRESAPRFKAVPVSTTPPHQAFAPSITLDKQDKLSFREHMDSLKRPEALAGVGPSGTNQQGRRRFKENVVIHSTVSADRNRPVNCLDTAEPVRGQPREAAAEAAPKTAPKRPGKPSISTTSSRSGFLSGPVTELLAAQLAKSREADEIISGALLTLICAGYIIQPPKQLYAEPERQRDDEKTTQEKAVPNGHAKRAVADPTGPVEAVRGAEPRASSIDEERKRIEAEISAAWMRESGSIAAMGSAKTPYQISFDQAASPLYDLSPPPTPKPSRSPGKCWLEPGKCAASPVPILDVGTDVGPSAHKLDDMRGHGGVDTAWDGEKSPCSATRCSSRHSWEANIKFPNDNKLPRIPPDCDDNLARRRADNEARLLNINIGLVIRLLTIAEDFVPRAHSRNVDIYPQGSHLLIRLLVTLRNHIPVHHDGLKPKPGSLRLLARLFAIIQPHMPEEGASPRMTNGGARRLLGDILFELRESYPFFDYNIGDLPDDYEPPRRRLPRPAGPPMPHGHIVTPYVPERARQGPTERMKQGNPVAPALDKRPSPAAHARMQQQHPPVQGGPVLPPSPPPEATARPAAERLKGLLPPHLVITQLWLLRRYLGCCSYVTNLGGTDPARPDYGIIFVPVGEEWRLTQWGGTPAADAGTGTTEKCRGVVGTAELGAYLAEPAYVVAILTADMDPRRPQGRYGAVLVPAGEEWLLRAWDGRRGGEPDGHQHQHQHQAVARNSPGKTAPSLPKTANKVTGHDAAAGARDGPSQIAHLLPTMLSKFANHGAAQVVMRSRPLSEL